MDIGFHEVGERFMYDGVMFQVVEGSGCENCEFHEWCNNNGRKSCIGSKRKDGNDVIYRRVREYTIYYADLIPCDNMQDYKDAPFVPQFITEDTKHFDTEPPVYVVQLATRLGWCIVAKWNNNGSTRIYALEDEAIKEGVEILNELCYDGCCEYANGEEKIYTKAIYNDDILAFHGYIVCNHIKR